MAGRRGLAYPDRTVRARRWRGAAGSVARSASLSSRSRCAVGGGSEGGSGPGTYGGCSACRIAPMVIQRTAATERGALDNTIKSAIKAPSRSGTTQKRWCHRLHAFLRVNRSLKVDAAHVTGSTGVAGLAFFP